jgi:hypothetical protein
VQRKIAFTPTADQQLTVLENDPSTVAICKQVRKTLGLLETNLRHPSRNTHEFTSIIGAGGEMVFEAYAQNNTPGAYRVFWHYGPDEFVGRKRISVILDSAVEAKSTRSRSRLRGAEASTAESRVITVVAITAHP